MSIPAAKCEHGELTNKFCQQCADADESYLPSVSAEVDLGAEYKIFKVTFTKWGEDGGDKIPTAEEVSNLLNQGRFIDAFEVTEMAGNK